MTTALPSYDEAYYRDYDGKVYERSVEWMGLFRHFAAGIVTSLRPQRTLDAGCALGLLVEALDEAGVESFGIDISDYAISQVPERVSERCKVQSLTEPIDGRYDLITCIEVIEHLPASEARTAVANLCAATDAVLLSSTPSEHEEPTHLNVQPPEYWSALFAENGFYRDLDYDASFISPWAVLYRRETSDTVDLVRSYDRAWWRLKDENNRVRGALIDAVSQRDVLMNLLTDAEQETVAAAADRDAAVAEVVQRARSEREDRHAGLESVAELQQARLQYADEILGARLEVGQALGRVAELEAELIACHGLIQRYNDLQEQLDAVLQSTSWRAAQAALAPYRRMRGID